MKKLLIFVMTFTLLLSTIHLLPSTTARASARTTYYVDSSEGNDSNAGTNMNTPWKSLNKINSFVFQPGDEILFKAEGSWNGVLQPQGSGNSSAQITVGMYGSGAKPHIEGNGAVAAVVIKNVEYWTISNLDVSNTASTISKRDGILISAKPTGITHGIYVENCEVHSVDGDYRRNYDMYNNAAIMATYPGTSSASNKFDGLYIQENYIHDVTTCGIKVTTDTDQAHDVNFENVVIQSNVISKTGSDGAIISHCINPMVQYNQCLDAGYYGTVADTQLIAGLWEDNTTNATFQYNEIARTRLFQGDGQALDTDWGSGGTIINQYNYTHDNQGGFFLNCADMSTDSSYVKTILRYNVSVNDQNVIISHDNSKTVEVYNNSFYKSNGTLSPGNSSTYKYWNNIFDFQSSPNWGPCEYKDNCYYPIAKNAGDITGISANPLFVNAGEDYDGMACADNYKLQSGSPCIDEGMNVTNNGGKDFWGNHLYGAPDIGANEYSGTVSVLNDGFESGALSSWNSSVGTGANVVLGNAHSGSYAAVLSGEGVGINQTITGLQPNTNYTLIAWAKVSTCGDDVGIGVNGFGGSEVWSNVESTGYRQVNVSFTTGPSNTTANIYAWKNIGSSDTYIDDFHVVRGPGLVSNGGFEKGTLSPWDSTTGMGASVIAGNAQAGSYSVLLSGASVGVNQTITGLQPNTTIP